MEKELLQEWINKGLPLREVAEKIGVAYTTIRYWVKKHGITLKSYNRKKWTEEEMCDAILSSETISDVLKKVGLSVRPGNYDTFHKFVHNKKIDISHLHGRRIARGGIKEIPIEDLTIQNCYFSRSKLKGRLLRAGVLEDRCYMIDCQNKSGMWRGEKLKMVLDHVNGVPTDNRIENLRLLCPNCNSQLSTHCGRNKKNE